MSNKQTNERASGRHDMSNEWHARSNNLFLWKVKVCTEIPRPLTLFFYFRNRFYRSVKVSSTKVSLKPVCIFIRSRNLWLDFAYIRYKVVLLPYLRLIYSTCSFRVICWLGLRFHISELCKVFRCLHDILKSFVFLFWRIHSLTSS